MNKKIKQLLLLFLFFFQISILYSEENNLNLPPKPLELSPSKITAYKTFKLANGLTVFLIEDHKLPTLSYVLYIDFVSKIKKNKAGLGEFTTRLMKQGAGKRSKEKLDEELDFMGTELSVENNLIYVNSLSKYAKESLEIFSDVVQNPEFNPNEFTRIKNEIIADLKTNHLDPNNQANELMKTLLYPESHPYREIPTEKTINQIKLEDCKSYHSKFFRPGNSYLAIIGDVKFDEAKKMVEKSFGAWANKKVNELKIPPSPKEEETKIYLLDRETSVQSVIKISRNIDLRPGDKNIYSAVVMNTILGGGTFRLYQNLREKNGYTYGVYSSLRPDKLAGTFSIDLSTKNSVTDKSIEEIFAELKRIREVNVEEEELQLVKNYLAGQFSLSLENPVTIALFAIKTSLYHLPENYFDQYVQNIRKVSAEDVRKAANRYLPTDKMKIVVVGKKKEIEKNLESLKNFKTVEVKDIK